MKPFHNDDRTSRDLTLSAPLETLYDPELGTLKFLHRCERYLRSGEGLNSHGLFRVTGDGDSTELVKSRLVATQTHAHALESVVFPTDEEDDDVSSREGKSERQPGQDKIRPARFGVLVITDVHSAASAMKAVLRYLPVPVVTYEARVALTHATAKLSGMDKEQGAWDDEMGKILLGMPSAHRSTLESVLSLLADVAQREDANSMSPANLGKIFAPSLMRTRDSDCEESAATAFAEIAIASKVLTRLITSKIAK